MPDTRIHPNEGRRLDHPAGPRIGNRFGYGSGHNMKLHGEGQEYEPDAVGIDYHGSYEAAKKARKEFLDKRK